MTKMKRLIAILVSLVYILLLCACSVDEGQVSEEKKNESEVVSSDSVPDIEVKESLALPQAVSKLIDGLQDTEFEVMECSLSLDNYQNFEHEIQNTYVLRLKNANSVYVFEFESEEYAKEHAGYYSEDGSKYNSPNISMMIDHIAPARMWQFGECIIEYTHQDNTAYLPICQIFGTPFVGKSEIIKVLEAIDIQYIRTDEMALYNYPAAVKITSRNELMEYYEENKEIFDLERKTTVYSDTTIGFLDACDVYTDEWFKANDLILAILQEGSGSNRHKVTSVTLRTGDLSNITSENTRLQVNIQTIIPSVGTCDMAQWHVMAGVPKLDEYSDVTIGINELWDTDFGEMMDSISSEKQYYTAKILEEESGSGEPSDYETLADEYLSIYQNLAFLSYEIVSIYPDDEAYELTELDSVLRNTTLYKVRVYYDHIADCEADYYLNVAHAGDEFSQYSGYPIYEVGQRFMSAIFGRNETWRVPIAELEFALIENESEEHAYHLGSELQIEHESLALLSMSENEKTLITSTQNNPMIFTGKYNPSALSEFIRKDWNERGFIK